MKALNIRQKCWKKSNTVNLVYRLHKEGIHENTPCTIAPTLPMPKAEKCDIGTVQSVCTWHPASHTASEMLIVVHPVPLK